MLSHSIPETNKSTFDILLGMLAGSLTTVMTYYFGSSLGSREKDAILGRPVSSDRRVHGACRHRAAECCHRGGRLGRDATRRQWHSQDIHDIKKALALEPVNGKIESAFIPRAEFRLREETVGKRLQDREEKLGDHEHRLTAVETRVGARP